MPECGQQQHGLKPLLIQQHGGLHILQTADDQDEFIGALSLGTAQEDSDVRAVDRFHGLRVAHPLEAHKMGQGITVGRDASCSLVVDQPSVSCTDGSTDCPSTFQSFLENSQYGAVLCIMLGRVASKKLKDLHTRCDCILWLLSCQLTRKMQHWMQQNMYCLGQVLHLVADMHEMSLAGVISACTHQACGEW